MKARTNEPVPLGREIELKLRVEPKHLAKLRRAAAIQRRAVGRASTRQLLSTYYDTEDLALWKAGLSLRVRKVGSLHVQTIKLGRDAARGVHMDVREIETLVPGPGPAPELIPDARLREKILALGAGRLQAIFETDIRRTVRMLMGPRGESVELAIDTGEIRVGEKSTEVSEIELELKRGSAASLFEIAKDLAEGHTVHVESASKAERGYALAEGAEPKPAKAAPLVLAPDATAATALTASLHACTRHLVANEAASFGSDPVEGIHQMRVALRRLRTSLTLFRSLIEGTELAFLVDEAKWLFGILGEARDLDVFDQEILAPVRTAFPYAEGISALGERAQKQRARARAAALRTLKSPRYSALVLDLCHAAEAEPWRAGERSDLADRTARTFAAECLRTRLKKVRGLGKRLEELSVPERHEMRIRLKKLRYACEFFQSLFPKKRTKPYLDRLSALQDIFGHLNDVATAETLLGQLVAPTEADRAESWAAGLVIGWHSHAAALDWANAKARWKAFNAAPPFWKA